LRDTADPGIVKRLEVGELHHKPHGCGRQLGEGSE
jgi:hypothetical protein